MKSLQRVQTIARVLHVLTIIAFVLTLIGAAGAFVGGVALLLFPLLGEEVFAAVVAEVPVDVTATGVSTLATGIVLLGELAAAGFLWRYLKAELSDGTPFTASGAYTLRRTGIMTVAAQIGASVIASLVVALSFTGAEFTSDSTLLPGLVMILLSFLLDHGAELVAQKSSNDTQVL